MRYQNEGQLTLHPADCASPEHQYDGPQVHFSDPRSLGVVAPNATVTNKAENTTHFIAWVRFDKFNKLTERKQKKDTLILTLIVSTYIIYAFWP